MNAYTGYQYISHRLARASAERRFVCCPAARTRLHRVVAKRPARGGGPLSGMQAPLELGEQDGSRPWPRTSVERQCADKERLEPIRQVQEARVGGRLADACVVGERRRCERMRP